MPPPDNYVLTPSPWLASPLIVVDCLLNTGLACCLVTRLLLVLLPFLHLLCPSSCTCSWTVPVPTLAPVPASVSAPVCAPLPAPAPVLFLHLLLLMFFVPAPPYALTSASTPALVPRIFFFLAFLLLSGMLLFLLAT